MSSGKYRKVQNIFSSNRKKLQNQVKMLTHIVTPIKKLMKNILNLVLVILLEYQNIKIFLQKITL